MLEVAVGFVGWDRLYHSGDDGAEVWRLAVGVMTDMTIQFLTAST